MEPGTGRAQTRAYIVTLNARHHRGLPGAANALEQMCSDLFSEPEGPPRPVRIAKVYYRCEFSVSEWGRLLTLDQQQARARAHSQSLEIAWDLDAPFTAADSPDPFRYQAIAKLWPDFRCPVRSIDRSITTIKADAAWRAFDASGEQITWAVIDSGVDASHPHFGPEGNLLADV